MKKVIKLIVEANCLNCGYMQFQDVLKGEELPPICMLTNKETEVGANCEDWKIDKEIFEEQFELVEEKQKAFLDIESNGFQGTSVLSIAVIKENGQVFERFYYPVEDYNQKAVKFNGLSEEVVNVLRGEDCQYEKYFIDDLDFIEFMSDVDTLICQNVIFDYSFLPDEVTKNFKNIFCTMKSNQKYFDGKWPNLNKLCIFYDVEVDAEKQHQALYDTELCKAVFEAMEERDIIYTHNYLTDTKKPR